MLSSSDSVADDAVAVSVLYVGRDADFAELVSTALQRESDRLDVSTETSLVDGLSTVEETPVDCVVTEYDLRAATGLDLLSAVRSWSADLPVVVYAADGDESVASRAISLGVSDYVRRETGREDFALLAKRIENAADRYRAEERLRRSDHHLADVYDRITDGVYAIDDDWTVVYWNDEMVRRTGVAAADACGTDVRDLFSEDVGGALSEAFDRAMTTNGHVHVETAVRSLGYRVAVDAYPDATGLTAFSRVVGESPVDDDFDPYRTVVESMQDPAFVLDGDGDVAFVNRRVEEMTGTPRERLLGTDFSGFVDAGLVPAEAYERFRTRVDEMSDEGVVDDRLVVPFVDDDGADHLFELQFSRIGADGGRAVVCVAHDVTDRERLESDYRTILARMTDGFLALDGDWRVTYLNDRARELMSDSRGVAVGDDLWETFPELVGTPVYDRYREAMRTGETKTYEMRGELDDAWYEIRLYPSESGLSVYFRDVTRRRRYVESLRDRTNQLETIVGNLPVVLVVLDADGDVVLAEGSALSDAAFDDPVGAAATDLFSHLESVTEALERALAGESQSVTIESDGRVYDAWLNPVFDGDGDVEEVIAVGIDVTDRERLERSLRDLQTTARRLITTGAPDEAASVAVDAVRTVVGWPIAAVWSYDPTADALVPVVETDEARAVVGETPAVDRGEGLLWETYETGSVHTYDRVRDEAGALNPETRLQSEVHLPLGDYGVLVAGAREDHAFADRDVDLLRVLAATATAAVTAARREQELRRREAELAAANDRLDDFASVVAHDLRNPLSVAAGYLDLYDDSRDPAHYEKAATALDRMNALVDDLLTFAREGAPLTDGEVVDLRRVVSNAWTFVDTGDATLDLDDLGAVVADDGRLLQLFENLFRNSMEHGSPTNRAGPGDAVEHGPPGDAGADDALSVTVGRLPDGSGFYVEDDGPGVPTDRRGRVFEHGYTTNREGTGFGLAIVANVAAVHGWSVRLVEGTTGGARFEFTDVEWVDPDAEGDPTG